MYADPAEFPTINLSAHRRFFQALEWHDLHASTLMDMVPTFTPTDVQGAEAFRRALHYPPTLNLLCELLGLNPTWLASGEGPVQPDLLFPSLAELWAALSRVDRLPSSLYDLPVADLHPLVTSRGPLSLWFSPSTAPLQFLLVETVPFLHQGVPHPRVHTQVVRYISPDTGHLFKQDLAEARLLLDHGWINSVQRSNPAVWYALVARQCHPVTVRTGRTTLPPAWTDLPLPAPSVPVRPHSEWKVLSEHVATWRQTGRLL